MKKLAIKSFQITEQPAFKYRLHCDDINGIIRMTKYSKTKSGKTRITERNIPIDEATKNKFYWSRTGYYDATKGDPFTGSYSLKEKDYNKYIYWEKYIDAMYKKLVDRENFKN